MGLSELFHYYWTEISDPRSRDWLLIGSPYQIPLILSLYLYIVLYWIPQYMKNKPPYSMKTFIRVYNVFQIVANIWIVREHIAFGWLTDIPLTCLPIVYSYEPRKYKMVVIVWWILVLKIIDCIETVIFALRKKHDQISILHLYHHVSTITIIWIFSKYMISEMATFSSFLNSIVHIIMYSYYFLVTFGPRFGAIIASIKRYITIIQMMQFFILIIYMMQIFLPSCDVPQSFAIIFILNVAINWFLFYKFYRKTYIPKVK